MRNYPEDVAGVDDERLVGQTALVTGSTSGIGRETALALGRLGAHVIVHGRDAEAGGEVVDTVEDAVNEGTAEFVRADFADPDDVAALADATRTIAAARDDPDDADGDAGGLDILVNNAGGYFRDAHLTDLGVEYTFHVNHLSPFQLTTDLLDDLAEDARVVTTASEAHRGDQIDLESVESIDGYSAWRAYQRSKLANLQFTAELARRLEERDDRSVTANCFHPGFVPGSGFLRDLPGPLSALGGVVDRLPFVTTPADGAATAVYLAVADEVATDSGRYYADMRPKQPSTPARDRHAQRRLWETSADLLEIDEPLPSRSEA
ncbi:SDR family NAD(P)-dependent oxidoreductase [Halobaculum sp. CBA1158]|uniref:SDR family NAD(P)-dependent oxidoreductase n=1 Tax=Halobaculum sp. CBA1158 TaxID=2904243 RepID=UPI001F3BF953|nr:SDR family NAD(P)-dependent oxidoreductase [Halobaculum sp. CBA1158]UIO99102.1 SDR family NAD(P)-dependent oxidoreductase [Halobaculum sp. CBA1158]